MAKDRGLKINEYGVFRVPAKSKKKDDGEEDAAAEKDPDSPNYVAGRTEAEVYATLDLPLLSARDSRSPAGIRLGGRRQTAQS